MAEFIKFNLVLYLYCSGLTITVFQYILPHMGLASDYAVFMARGRGKCRWVFEVMGNIATLVGDLTGQRAIEYDLTLPLPQWLVFTRIAVSNVFGNGDCFFFILPLSN